MIRHYTHKGYSDTSTWGRAQSWGALLSVMSYAREAWRDAMAPGS